MNIADQSSDGYSYRQVHFVWAHLEEYQALEENPGEAGKDIRAALDHEWNTLPEHTVCTCGTLYEKIPELAGRGSGGTAGKAPSSVLLDMERAYEALPMYSQARTRLYLQKVLGMTETAIRNMHGREFEARHRRRVMLETFQPGRPFVPRLQDNWDVIDPFEVMTDFLNLGELQFLGRHRAQRRAA